MRTICITCVHNINCLNGTYCRLRKCYTEQCLKFDCEHYEQKENVKQRKGRRYPSVGSRSEL